MFKKGNYLICYVILNVEVSKIVSVTLYIRKKNYDLLREYCKRKGVNESFVINKILEVGLEKLMEVEKERRPEKNAKK